MSIRDTYLAVFTGAKDSARRRAWNAMSDAERRAKEQEGIAAWGDWVEKHKGSIVYEGGPLGKTKRASRDGVTDVVNDLAVFIVVRAASHEDAAKLFEGHPHFTISPCAGVEAMPLVWAPEGAYGWASTATRQARSASTVAVLFEIVQPSK